MKTLLSIALFALASCTPQAYIADLTTYEDAIKANPQAVTIQPEHITQVGGFKMDGSAIVETDHGSINVDQDGVSGSVVVDLSSNE
jgi:hypothetical protein